MLAVGRAPCAADGEVGALEKGGEALRLRATVYLCGCGAARRAHTKAHPAQRLKFIETGAKNSTVSSTRIPRPWCTPFFPLCHFYSLVIFSETNQPN